MSSNSQYVSAPLYDNLNALRQKPQAVAATKKKYKNILSLLEHKEFVLLREKQLMELRVHMVYSSKDGFDFILCVCFNFLFEHTLLGQTPLMFSRDELYPTGYGFPVRKGSPYLDAMNKRSRKFFISCLTNATLVHRIQIALDQGLYQHWAWSATRKGKILLNIYPKSRINKIIDRLVSNFISQYSHAAQWGQM